MHASLPQRGRAHAHGLSRGGKSAVGSIAETPCRRFGPADRLCFHQAQSCGQWQMIDVTRPEQLSTLHHQFYLISFLTLINYFYLNSILLHTLHFTLVLSLLLPFLGAGLERCNVSREDAQIHTSALGGGNTRAHMYAQTRVAARSDRSPLESKEERKLSLHEHRTAPQGGSRTRRSRSGGRKKPPAPESATTGSPGRVGPRGPRPPLPEQRAPQTSPLQWAGSALRAGGSRATATGRLLPGRPAGAGSTAAPRAATQARARRQIRG